MLAEDLPEAGMADGMDGMPCDSITSNVNHGVESDAHLVVAALSKNG